MMFTKSIVFPSIVEAVNKVLEEDSKAKLLLEPEKKSPEVAGGVLQKKRDDKRAATGHNSEMEEDVHPDEKEDKGLIKKMVKKTALKPEESKETELDSHHKMTTEGAHTQHYFAANKGRQSDSDKRMAQDTSYGRHREHGSGELSTDDKKKTSWRRDPIAAFSDRIHATVAGRYKKSTNEEVEQIDELNRDTLHSYTKKANKSVETARRSRDNKKTLKSFKNEDIGGISTMSEKEGESQVRVDGETDMDTKTVDSLAGRRKVKADYHNKPLSYKVGLTVGEELENEGLADDFLKHAQGMKNHDGSSKFPNAKITTNQAGVKKPQSSHTTPAQKTQNPPESHPQGWYGQNRYMGDSVEYDGAMQTEHKGTENDSVPFVQNANTTSSPLKMAKEMAHRSFKKMKTETLGSEGKK